MSTTINEMNEYIQDKIPIELTNPGDIGCKHLNLQNSLEITGSLMYPDSTSRYIGMYIKFCSNCGLILERT